MSYIVFARKYRPKKFDEIIGQSHITTTLKNAISKDRVAHAYLFAGPRGVGKTTAARILAKALNCEKGLIPEPCDKCDSCKEITAGRSLDVLEIDGASNRGIDEIRNLKESIRFSPSKGRFKAYIIDEVHMLTAEAFNALLKTLEEPPAHVKFVFATTQAHKVPATILSRCQRFDFRRISTKDILANLKTIAKEEKLNVNDKALSLIAKHADGSLRDGQVVLDQIISYTQGTVEAGDVVSILGVVSEEALFGLVNTIKDKDAASALTMIDRLMNDGKDVIQIALNLIEHFRNLAVAKISEKPQLLIDASAESIERYAEQAAKFTIEEILYMIYGLSNTLELMKRTTLARIPLEAAMVKFTKLGSILPLDEIMARIDRLESGAPAIQTNPPAPPSRPSASNPPPSSPASEPSPISGELEDILSSWAGVINRIKAKKMSVASYLEEGYPAAFDGRTITIAFSKEFQFHKEVLETPENKRMIEEALNETLNGEFRIALVFAQTADVERPPLRKDTSGGTDTEDAPRPEEGPGKETDPIIENALEIFGAQVARRDAGKGKPK